MVSAFIKLIQTVDLRSLVKLETEHLKVWIKPLALSYANCVALDMLTSIFSSIRWEQWFLFLSRWFWGFHKETLEQSKHLVNVSSLTALGKICFFLFIIKHLSHYNGKMWFWYLLFKWSVTHSVVSHSLQPCALWPQTPPSMGLSRQEYWRGFPFPPPGDLPKPGTEPGSPALQADSLLSESP